MPHTCTCSDQLNNIILIVKKKNLTGIRAYSEHSALASHHSFIHAWQVAVTPVHHPVINQLKYYGTSELLIAFLQLSYSNDRREFATVSLNPTSLGRVLNSKDNNLFLFQTSL